MPPKKSRGNQSRDTAGAKRLRRIRETETPEASLRRLESNARRSSDLRSNEISGARLQRLEADILRHVGTLVNETAEPKSQRLMSNAASCSSMCRNETPLERDQRLRTLAHRRAQQQNIRRMRTRNSARITKGEDLLTEQHFLGELNYICQFCNSRNFSGERPRDGKFSYCCQKGKIKLNPHQFPDLIKDLLLGMTKKQGILEIISDHSTHHYNLHQWE